MAAKGCRAPVSGDGQDRRCGRDSVQASGTPICSSIAAATLSIGAAAVTPVRRDPGTPHRLVTGDYRARHEQIPAGSCGIAVHLDMAVQL
jgi:hypothetical protein